MHTRFVIRIAGLSGALAVLLGAFGAHGLRDVLEPGSLEVWRTASFYHFIHTLAILAALVLPIDDRWRGWALRLFGVGILLFAGSLYLLSTSAVHGWAVSWLGPITPLGGLAFAGGWVCLAIASRKR
jgi:uncharacterized membrane protein YgdD (TMEM256/DUF423 family)